MAIFYLDKTGLAYFWGKIKSYITETIPPKMTILSYGKSTWDDFIAAYNSNTIVYCRASSNSNPASGNQTRMAFMAYVNSNPPTEVQFQYYRSVSSHSATQQGDQVYIYKLNKTNGWSVTTREAMSKIAAGTGLSSSYSNGTITLSATNTPDLSNYATKSELNNKQDTLTAGDNITINNGVISATGGDPLIGALFQVTMQTGRQLPANTRTYPTLRNPSGAEIVTCDLSTAKFRPVVPGTFLFNINLDVEDTATSGDGYVQCHLGVYDNSDTMEDEFYAGKHVYSRNYGGGVYSFAIQMDPEKYYVPTFLYTRYGSNTAQVSFGWIQIVYLGQEGH